MTKATPGSDELPDGTFDAALNSFQAAQVRRVRAMFNRHRALFAEALVAELLPGAKLVDNPTGAWDVEWSVEGNVARIQVKCSGQYLPMHPSSVARATWKLSPPKYGWDPNSYEKLAAGHHCDAFVLARHVGQSIELGWTFAVLRSDELANWTSMTPQRLIKLGRTPVPPALLATEVRRLVGGS